VLGDRLAIGRAPTSRSLPDEHNLARNTLNATAERLAARVTYFAAPEHRKSSTRCRPGGSVGFDAARRAAADDFGHGERVERALRCLGLARALTEVGGLRPARAPRCRRSDGFDTSRHQCRGNV
jgi:hypothetical protein